MTIVSATDARNNFQELVNRVQYGRERILVQRRGKPVVAIIGIEDLNRLEALEDARDSEALRQAIAENDGFTSLESIVAARGE